MKELTVVGKPLQRMGDREKSAGAARYGADITLPGMLHAKVVRSSHPHAKLVSIDASKALALEGVVAVASAQDTPQKLYGFGLGDETVFAQGKVRYCGEPVAAVAATDPYVAEEAAGLVEVQYEPLPAVVDVEDAMEPDAPLVHEAPASYEEGLIPFPVEPNGNITTHTEIIEGDIEKGFAESDVILEERYVTAPIHQSYIEPHACLACWAPDGKLTVWTSAQGPFVVRGLLAKALDLPMSRVNVVPMEIGGGFGGKVASYVEPIAAVLAMKTGRPMQLVLSRQEELEDARPRCGTVTEVKTGVKKDGTLVARTLKFIVDNGAYTDFGPGTSGAAVEAGRGPYRIPNVHFDGYSVWTNKFNTGPFRAPGFPQITFALESHMDALAGKLGMCPVELRRKNALRKGDSTFAGTTLKKDIFVECLDQVVARIEEDPDKDAPNTGWGIGCGEWRTGGSPSGATLKINEDGTASLIIGAPDLTGSRTSIAQVAAEELGVRMDQLMATVGDTDEAPLAPVSAGSMATYNLTNVVRKTAAELRQKIAALAATALKASEEDIDIEEGVAFVRDDPEKRATFAELAAEQQVALTVTTDSLPATHAFAVHGVKVRVDPDTGQCTVLRAIGALDCGKAINPLSVAGQIGGGLVQCLGQALCEEIVLEDDGRVATRSLTDYKLPTAMDVPPVEPIIVEGDLSASDGHGCKGVGEPVHVPTAAAIANAIRKAVGARLYELPMTPEKIYWALQNKGDGA
ncbi:MAG: xanthine dehydrogenase family protein molybdopterin-binding subunit [Armatimonadota bacterium]